MSDSFYLLFMIEKHKVLAHLKIVIIIFFYISYAKNLFKDFKN